MQTEDKQRGDRSVKKKGTLVYVNKEGTIVCVNKEGAIRRVINKNVLMATAMFVLKRKARLLVRKGRSDACKLEKWGRSRFTHSRLYYADVLCSE